MGATVYVGLAVTSHADGTLATAKFDNVTITTPMPLPPGRPPGWSRRRATPRSALAWGSVSGASGYTVKRGTNNNGPYTDVVASGLTGDQPRRQHGGQRRDLLLRGHGQQRRR